MTSLGLICSNWSPENTDCKKSGKYGCRNCQLVTYCDKPCQQAHWPLHKVACKSPLRKDIWQPAWALEGRAPAFMRTGNEPGVMFGNKKYLWGNMPAFDLLRLDANEGSDYSGNLRVLCAASGDLRHVVKTIAQLPSSYNGLIEMTLNDRDFDIVARNVVLLLIAMVVEDIDTAANCMIHLWYSALIRDSDLNVLQQQVRPLINDVCTKIADKPSDGLFGKTWTFGQRSVRVVLEKPSWIRLLSFLDVPAGLDAHQAQAIRAEITLAESRKEYRDRYLYSIPQTHRVAFTRFREDGLLLPFGFPRHDFQVPNPTFYHDASSWPMLDNADPRHGWAAEDVANAPYGPASADIYGKLYFYLRRTLSSFMTRLRDLEKASFKLFQVDAASLPDHLELASFARIEVSNISDYGWLGIHRTLFHMIPLLQNKVDNPHATLITLFLNAVEETENQNTKPDSASTRKLLQYIPLTSVWPSRYDPTLVKFDMARDLVTDHDTVFDRYCDKLEFQSVGQLLGAAMKAEHTIIDKWPFKLKLKPGQVGAQEEFDRYLSSGISSKERYVEWKRTE